MTYTVVVNEFNDPDILQLEMRRNDIVQTRLDRTKEEMKIIYEALKEYFDE